MDFAESELHRDIRASVRAIAEKYGHAYYQRTAAEGSRSEELWNEVAEAGFVGVNLPEEYGGGGLGISELAIVGEELAAHGCPLLLLVVSPAICGTVISAYGTSEQKRRWLPDLCSGSAKMAFAITEPEAGSNSHQLATRASREGEEWVLNGTKHYISGVDESREILVVARTGRTDSGRGRLSLFVVPTDAAGLSMHPIPMQVNAPEKQFTLTFEDVRLPAGRLLGEEGEGLRQIFVGLNPERIMTAAHACGLARYALDKAARYAQERVVWGVPIGAHQGVAHPLAEASIHRDLAWLMTQRAAWLVDAGMDPRESGVAANSAKFAAADAAGEALDRAIQVHGGHGLSTEFGLADLWGFVRLHKTAPVSREMVLNHIAQQVLHLPRSY